MTRQIETGLNTPLTSSCGRLFDAVAALIGVRGVISYEGQAAIELEMLAAGMLGGAPESRLRQSYPFQVVRQEGRHVVRVGPLLEAVVEELRGGTAPAAISQRFHATVAAITRQTCARIRDESGLNLVALSGGCFQNRLLLHLTVAALQDDGFRVVTHRRVPANDGGIALGQVAVAAHRLGP